MRDDLRFLIPLLKQARQSLDLKSIRVFGSFARGDYSQSSDVDLAFDFYTRNDNDWVNFKLWVNDDFKSLRHFDLMDISDVAEELKNSILSEGIILYER